jgi:putative transposase
MPDHLHVVLQVQNPRTTVAQFVAHFKAIITRAGRPQGYAVWQRSFHDHVLRDYEDFATRCRYVVDNPVRKGMVAEWQEYPYAWLSEVA